jgi:hypothetical protein
MHFLQQLLNWSELWATALPIIVWFIVRPRYKIFYPIIIYLLCGLILYTLIDLSYLKVLENNNFVYNILSVVRLLFFVWFFNLLEIPSNKTTKKLATLFITIVLIIMIIFGDIHDFNSQIFAFEAVTLISYCVIYFLKTLNDDTFKLETSIVLLVITGLAIYESCCFFVFLFYSNLTKTDIPFAVSLWNIHNIVYIVMCLYISLAFFELRKYELVKS